ncbi:MAG: metal ABC transporter permease [Aestuariivirga sp.]
MIWLNQLLVLPLSFPFMQRALFVAVIIAICCAVMSCFLILRGWSLMGDAISHAVLPGIVLAAAAGLPLAIGAFLAALICATGSGWLNANSRVKSDTVLGIVFSGMFALGLVLFTMIDSDQHLLHILFGNVLGVQTSDVAEVVIFGGGCLAFVLLRRRDLLLASFDPAHAKAIGLPVAFLHYGMLVALALTIVVSIKAVGVILVVAMLIAPGAIGFLMTSRFDAMLLISVVSAIISAAAGTIASFHLDAATGACIVLAQAALFVAALLFAPRKGLLAIRKATA